MASFNTDIPELSGLDTAVCLANLERLGWRQSRLTESLLSALSELADAILRDGGGDPDTVESILLSLQDAHDESEESLAEHGDRHVSARDAVTADVASVNRDLVLRLSVGTEVHLRLILYRFISERMPPDQAPAALPASVTDAAKGRIAYMAGAFADKAYAVLSSPIPASRAATFHSFVDACEEVRGGLCEYAILPLENSHSGKLTAFSRLILRYGLVTVAVCDLENRASPGQVTRFALLCRAPDDLRRDRWNRWPFPQHALFQEKADSAPSPLCLEILHASPTVPLSEMLDAARFCGLTPVRIDTLPAPEESETERSSLPICCVLTASGQKDPFEQALDLATFARFLSAEAPEDIVMGVYRNIREHTTP